MSKYRKRIITEEYNIMMIRSFLPVGQGAFYRETFKINGDKINIIYDCGSATDIK